MTTQAIVAKEGVFLIIIHSKYFSFSDWLKSGGLATAFDLAAFRLSMIAPVKKSVNHLRTVVSMHETGCSNKFVFAAIRQCEVNSLLVPLVIAFFAVTNFFFRGNVELTFSFLLVLRLSLHTVYYAKNETNEHVPRCPTF